MRAVLAPLMALLMLSGCLEAITGNDNENDPSLLPEWEIGTWWLYTFVTPEFGEDSARLVVADSINDEGHWMVGISSEKEAQRHAVVNHNPFLGRVTFDQLSVYENGEPQRVFNFPWEQGSQWNFVLFSQSWNARTASINDQVIRVTAESSENHDLEYYFDKSKGFISKLTWHDDQGETRLFMTLNDYGTNHAGDVWFIRATDLLDNRYNAVDGELYDTFLDEGHPSGSDFDRLVWYLDVDIASGGTGTLSMKDHVGTSALTRQWGSNSQESGSIGIIPSVSGEYSLTVTLSGQSSFIHLKVAGGLVNQWTL